MTTVITIVRAHLAAGGFDGLVLPAAECGCLLSDLAPCDGNISQCMPGYRGADEDGDPGDWAMYSTKERAMESLATVKA